MAFKSGNTAILSISPDADADFYFTIKKDFISVQKHISHEPLLNSTTNSQLQLGKDRKRQDNDELGGLIRWCTRLIFCSCVLVLLATMLLMFFLIENDQLCTWQSAGSWVHYGAPVPVRRNLCGFLVQW